ncbi:2'-5' RNA ligase family protein [Rhodoflexus caldus]|uniref:2'-5' RNA ligase family protein n=1 Tax=Rhodoflexus caldus TaxID=2891236 RepID=UPI00202AAB6A|nr:2'-5' RNA ligase family protein [Rhodoflexus caldus]
MLNFTRPIDTPQKNLMTPNWFVALPVRGTETLLETLAATAPPEVRLFAPEDTHLTIAFMGAMPKERAAEVLKIMQKIDFEPFQISLANLIPLPSAKHTSAFSYKLDQGHWQVVTLMEEWRSALLQAGGAPPDNRPPLPHLTIGRPQRKWGRQGVEQGIRWANNLPPVGFEALIDSVALYTWSDDRRRNQFKIVEEFVV